VLDVNVRECTVTIIMGIIWDIHQTKKVTCALKD